VKKFAWSYSALTSFETCPLRHKLTRIDKTVTEPQSEHIRHGNEVHKAMERYLKKEAALPAKYSEYQPYADAVVRRDGKLLVEHKIALNKSFRPTGYFDSDVWVRSVFDVAVIRPDSGVMLDWKTGKPKEDPSQMQLFAAVGFSEFPYVQKFDTGFVWLGHKKLTPASFVKDDAPAIWREFLVRVNRMEEAAERDKYPARPSGLCRAHCPVPRSICEFSGRE
jgi:hypothetical protein